MKMQPKTLYHFTKADTAIRRILPDKKLRMNFLSNMNDPQENLFHIVNIDDNVFEKQLNEILSFQYFYANYIRNETRVLAFSTDKQVKSENIDICIKGYQFQKMWATYGQNNEGICLVIDFDKFKKENEEVINKYEIKDDSVIYKHYQFLSMPEQLYGTSPVNQKKLTPKSDKEYLIEYLKKYPDFVNKRFFTKNIDWEGESEYRFLTFKNDGEELFLSIKDSLVKVIVGINFSKYFLPALSQLISKDKIWGIKLYSTEGYFTIEEIYN